MLAGRRGRRGHHRSRRPGRRFGSPGSRQSLTRFCIFLACFETILEAFRRNLKSSRIFSSPSEEFWSLPRFFPGLRIGSEGFQKLSGRFEKFLEGFRKILEPSKNSSRASDRFQRLSETFWKLRETSGGLPKRFRSLPKIFPGLQTGSEGFQKLSGRFEKFPEGFRRDKKRGRAVCAPPGVKAMTTPSQAGKGVLPGQASRAAAAPTGSGHGTAAART